MQKPPQAQIADSSSRNAVSFLSGGTTEGAGHIQQQGGSASPKTMAARSPKAQLWPSRDDPTRPEVAFHLEANAREIWFGILELRF